MNRKLCCLLAGVVLIALTGAANAGQPMLLSDTQMDRITAGDMAFANVMAMAEGNIIASAQGVAIGTVSAGTLALGMGLADAKAKSAGSQSSAQSGSMTGASLSQR